MSHINVFMMKRLKAEYEKQKDEINSHIYEIDPPEFTHPMWEGRLLNQYTHEMYPFRIYFPNNYPRGPPKIFFYKRRPPIPVAFTPQGEMCLQMTDYSKGPGWIPNCSIHILLISIQSLIVNSRT